MSYVDHQGRLLKAHDPSTQNTLAPFSFPRRHLLAPSSTCIALIFLRPKCHVRIATLTRSSICTVILCGVRDAPLPPCNTFTMFINARNSEARRTSPTPFSRSVFALTSPIGTGTKGGSTGGLFGSTKAVILRAGRAYDEGEEFFVSYGPKGAAGYLEENG